MIISIIYIAGCSSIPNPYSFGGTDNVVAMKAKYEISENELLDVAIQQFNPGELPEDEDDRRGLSDEIRQSEARFMPIHLKYTMQRTGYWGNVRVVPDENIGNDVLVQGTILNSDGETIEVEIKVKDSRNKMWFEKTYEETLKLSELQNTEVEKKDLFQNLYTQISNDIIKYREKLKNEDLLKIKQTSELRFAEFMAPEIFKYYIKKNKNEEYEIKRIPSINDPMFNRVSSIKARDQLLVDTINNYYNIYYSDMWESYENWRKFRSEELETIREIEKKALTQKILGAAAIIGAIALGASNNVEVRDRTGVLSSVMVAGGTYALYSGFKTSKETEINKEAIEELGASFTAEVEPMIIQVQGKTMTLTGSAEQQYAKWRKLLNEIYKKETGL